MKRLKACILERNLLEPIEELPHSPKKDQFFNSSESFCSASKASMSGVLTPVAQVRDTPPRNGKDERVSPSNKQHESRGQERINNKYECEQRDGNNCTCESLKERQNDAVHNAFDFVGYC